MIAAHDRMMAVVGEVVGERRRQDGKWGVQNHSPTNWLPILSEEFGEVGRALCELKVAEDRDGPESMNAQRHRDNYREELIQLAAVAVAMVESYDRNEGVRYGLGTSELPTATSSSYHLSPAQESEGSEGPVSGPGRL